ncbi:hypothetical protein ACJJTC_016762 [Scirpophaga incertulas]
MENSVSEGDTQECFRSPPRRRRSTFFEKRDSSTPQTLFELNTDPSAENDDGHDKINQELASYYLKLMCEKELWKKEVNNRKNKYHDLRQQYQIAAKSSSRSRISYSALSTDDIEFLKAKPNISKLIESQLKLHKSVKETQALVRRVNELDDVILRHSEDQINRITEYILENSTIEPVD